MSGEAPLANKIEGYTVSVFKAGNKTLCVDEFDLKLSKVGGAHVENPKDLIMLIEDAVFKEENK